MSKINAWVSQHYFVYVMLGNPKQSPPWHHDVWQKISFILKNGLQQEEKAGLRVRQYDKQTGKQVKFGGLTLYDERSAKKWTHQQPLPDWEFDDLEIWQPNANKCAKDSRPPNFYLQIAQYSSPGASFNPIILLAFNDGLYQRVQCHDMVLALANYLQPRLIVFRQRSWAYLSKGGFSMQECINDLPYSGLFKVGLRDHLPVSKALFSECWEELSPSK